MEQHDYAAELPQEPPEGLIPWLQKRGKLQEHVIWYKAAWVHDPLTGQRKRMAELRCSACGGTMYADRIPNPGNTFGYLDPESGHPVSNGNHVLCPMCGCSAEALHIGRGRGGHWGKEYWPLTIIRVGDKLALVGWCVGKFISCEGAESISCRQYEAYVVEEHKVVRLMGYIKWMSSISFFRPLGAAQGLPGQLGRGGSGVSLGPQAADRIYGGEQQAGPLHESSKGALSRDLSQALAAPPES